METLKKKTKLISAFTSNQKLTPSAKFPVNDNQKEASISELTLEQIFGSFPYTEI